MPQLNPSPWFPIFMLAWAFFLTIMPSKVMSHTFNNEPLTISTSSADSISWNWPWH